MNPAVRTVILLTASNVLTFAWNAHLKNLSPR
jgi:uncharacterized protein (DUF486 family)